MVGLRWGDSASADALVGRRIRQARQELGLTLAEFADAVGIPPGLLDRFEAGRDDASRRLERIADVTGRPASWYTSDLDDDTAGVVQERALSAELRGRLAMSNGRRGPADTAGDRAQATSSLTTEDRLAQLGVRAEELDRREAALGRRSAELDAREAALEKAAKDASVMSSELAARDAELRIRSAQLDTREAGLALRLAQLDMPAVADAEAEAEASLTERGHDRSDVEFEAQAVKAHEESVRASEEGEHGGAKFGRTARRLDGPSTNAEPRHGRRPPMDVHLAVAPDRGYKLVERAGAAPQPGTIVELDNVRYRCLRVQASPFLNDERRCAVLETLPPSYPAEESE